MLKNILISIVLSLVLIKTANCQRKDTIITYFKTNVYGNREYTTSDSCEYLRMIIAPHKGEKLYTIKEYYRNTNIKFSGKCEPEMMDRSGVVLLQGDCISFFDTGKRQSIGSYENGSKQGFEYNYYPDGKLYCVFNFVRNTRNLTTKVLFVDCYDKNGSIICNKGNGRWIQYYPDFKTIDVVGEVINGLKEGPWEGKAMLNGDSIKYVYNYHEDKTISRIGYTKDGVSYPFTRVIQAPFNNTSIDTFILEFNKKFKAPKDANGHIMNIDTVHIGFIIERNGTLTHFETVGKIDVVLKNALLEAFNNIASGWEPRKYYGIPMRSKMIAPVKFTKTVNGHISMYSETILEKFDPIIVSH